MKPYYEQDGITIYHGDALDILPMLSGVGAVITDPPYSSGGAFRGDRAQTTVDKYVQSGTLAYRPEFGGDSRDQRSFLAWAMLWLNAARNACVQGAVVASFIDWRQLPVMTDAIQCGGWTWRGVGTWWKPGIRMQSGGLSGSSEFVVWGTFGPMDKHEGYAQNVFQCAPVSDKRHIAEKPEQVMSWVLNIAQRGSVVLDPFMGSGTTLRAAKDLGHCAIGIEADEAYCEIAAKRLAQQVMFAEAS